MDIEDAQIAPVGTVGRVEGSVKIEGIHYIILDITPNGSKQMVYPCVDEDMADLILKHISGDLAVVQERNTQNFNYSKVVNLHLAPLNDINNKKNGKDL